MLARQGILTEADAEAIERGLNAIQAEIESGEFQFSDALEDIHMNVEFRLEQIIGRPAGRLHTARSRNDQVATDFRIWIRDEIAETVSGLFRLMGALLTQAEGGTDSVMPGFTHLQTAQPVTWGHHMLAYVEMFGRDTGRFRDAAFRMNESPLGAAALAGTPYPVDPESTAQELGFRRPMRNSMDAVSARDFAAEYLSAAAICASNLSRLAEEIVLWTSSQFRFASLGDRFTTGSSIMPQKRNPDGAELVRAKAGRINGSLVSLLTVMKALPLAYSKDLQEDKEQVFDAADTLALSIAAMTGMIEDLKPDPDIMLAAASEANATATDLTDWLVRVAQIPFREAHHATGRLVRLAEERNCALADLPLEVMQSVNPHIGPEATEALDARQSASSRKSPGGTAPARVREQIAYWKERLQCDNS